MIGFMETAAVWISALQQSHLDCDQVESLIRRHITPADRVEHLRVRAGPDGVVVIGFFMAASSTEARIALQRITRKALTSEPELRAWRVI